MFPPSVGVIVTLSFHYGPIRAPDRGGGGGNYCRLRHLRLSSPQRRQTLTDGAAARSADTEHRKSDRMTATRQSCGVGGGVSAPNMDL